MDPALVAAAIDSRTRAIVAVELYGEPGRIERLAEVAAGRGVPLVEDAAQSFGARIRGRAVGTFGALGCFSFQPTKPLGAWGDAGMVVTSDAALAERCRRARVHGASGKHQHSAVGGNYRLDALQAAVLAVKLAALPRWIAERREHARAYSSALSGVRGLVTPPVMEGAEASHSLYTIRITEGRRDEVARELHDHGIETAVHYPLPLHRQSVLLDRGFGLAEGALPNVELAAREVLSIPLYPELSAESRERVVQAIVGAQRSTRARVRTR
jgi:dTDP-4-amino-4,6-dideoxygalactose transaminase